LSSLNFKPRVICDQQCKLKPNDAYRVDKHCICHGNVDRQLDRFTSFLGCGAASIGYWRQSSSDVASDPRRMESSSALRKRKTHGIGSFTEGSKSLINSANVTIHEICIYSAENYANCWTTKKYIDA